MLKRFPISLLLSKALLIAKVISEVCLSENDISFSDKRCFYLYDIFIYIICRPLQASQNKNIYIYKVSVWSLEASFAKLFCATSIALQL